MVSQRLWFFVLVICSLLTACAQDIGDIDRTQPSRVKKSELAGDWFFAQTVTEVPSTNIFSFIGETSSMERIRWDIQENYLIAYRSYARIGNSDPNETFDNEDYTESPIAAFPITGHFDVRRAYNSSTGEQSNVVEENSYDRPWYERDYFRVDWSRNLITNFEFISTPAMLTNLDYFVQAEQGGPDAFYESRDNSGNLRYFDFVGKMHVVPDFWGCLFTYYGWSAEDCTAAEIKVRSSFLRAEKIREYEPVQYDDRLMSKFGYFRTERFNHDQWRGITHSGRTYLGQRFAIWDKVWERDQNGELILEDGRPIAIAMKDRTPKPIVYHVSDKMPAEMMASSMRVAHSWDKAFRRAVAAAQDIDLDEVPRMFVVCHNPVIADDHEACGEEGTHIRIGDIRYNQMYWVDRPQGGGLLGYGPSGADPLTGEIVFGSAYVYGTEVDTWSQHATDIVRLLNDDLGEDDVLAADYIRHEVMERLGQRTTTDPPMVTTGRSAKLKDVKLPSDPSALVSSKHRARLDQIKSRSLPRADFDHTSRVMNRIKNAGLDDLLLTPEIQRAMAPRHTGSPAHNIDDATRQAIAPSNWANAQKMNQRTGKWIDAARHNLYLSAFADDSILGYATQFKGEKDYIKIRQQIREAIYQAVMEHEVGHTIGLRHNFQGSYDALNYHDQYWRLRKENLDEPEYIDDLYTMSQPTEKQIKGRMQEYAYSSIMDYGMRFNSDIQGIGKYDQAAIIFGYTTGVHDVEKGVEPGFVEVFNDTGTAARRILRRYEDPDSLAYPPMLENVHYTTVARAFGDVEKMADRRLVPYAELNRMRARAASTGNPAPTEVNYMFCSDEWVDALVSCQLFDAGADPFEIVRHINENYRNYYALSHYERDQPFFWPEDILYRMYGRYFAPLTTVYQNFVFAYYWGTDDETIDNYFLFAALSAFNQLADVVLTPEIGSYELQNDGQYALYSYGPELGADLVINFGDGRSQYSEYKYDSGYYYFDRVETVGHFWDFLAAIFALTDSEATRLGVDADADSLTYSIPWYLFFEEELTELVNSVFLIDGSRMGPRVIDGKLHKRPASMLYIEGDDGEEYAFDPETGAEFTLEPEGAAIVPETGFDNQVYSLLYGMAYFTSNYSLNFPDQMQIFRLGSGEAVEPADGFEWVIFDDPIRGHRFGALQPVDAQWDTGAIRLVEQGQYWATKLNDATTQSAYDEAYYYLESVVERINLARSMYEYFGTVF